MAGDAVGLAPLVALEQDIRTREIALLPFTAPWLQLSYGLFYTRKRPLSRVAQLFMTQLRQVEVVLQAREQRALARLDGKQAHAPAAAKRKVQGRRRTGGPRREVDRRACPPDPDPPMKRIAVGLLCLAMSAASLAAGCRAPATYRLDLFHTGGKGAEIFAVDRLRQEPLPWPGHPARATDDGKSGVYRFEVRDADGQLLQARGYASIFGEWVTTDEAQAPAPHLPRIAAVSCAGEARSGAGDRSTGAMRNRSSSRCGRRSSTRRTCSSTGPRPRRRT